MIGHPLDMAVLGVCTGSGQRGRMQSELKVTGGIRFSCKRLTYMKSAKVKVEHSEPSLCYANYINQHRDVRLNNRHIEIKT